MTSPCTSFKSQIPFHNIETPDHSMYPLHSSFLCGSLPLSTELQSQWPSPNFLNMQNAFLPHCHCTSWNAPPTLPIVHFSTFLCSQLKFHCLRTLCDNPLWAGFSAPLHHHCPSLDHIHLLHSTHHLLLFNLFLFFFITNPTHPTKTP